MDLRLVALAVFFLSLLALLLLSDCPDVRVGEIEKHVGRCVTVCGLVVERRITESACIYALFDGNTLRAVQFRPYTCRTGYICVRGRVEVYRGEPELVVLEYT